VNLRSRQLLCVLMTWVVLAQQSLAAVLGPEHVIAEHGGAEVGENAGGQDRHFLADAKPSTGVSKAPNATRAAPLSQTDRAHHHGCDHACAHFLGLPQSTLPVVFPRILNRVSWYCATWRSQPCSPPERPPRPIA
jgi:hypothetical protein